MMELTRVSIDYKLQSLLDTWAGPGSPFYGKFLKWNGFAAFAGVMAALLFSDVAVRAAPTPAPAMSFLLTPETLPVVSDNFDEPLAVIPKTPTPAMVPVSSTVIPVTNVKPPSARQAPVVRYQSRRFSFFDKSSKPDTPIRLITKNTNLKKYYESLPPES